MKYCTNCGEPRRDGASYCPRCGIALDEAQPAPRAVAVVPVKEEKKQGLNVCAIVGFALAFCVPVAGLVVSIIARNKAKSGEYSKPLTDFADAGFIVSILMMVFTTALALLYTGVCAALLTKLIRLIGDNSDKFQHMLS